MDLKIKVCGMREEVNVLKVSELKPDLMGFIFYPFSKRYVGDDFNPSVIYSVMLKRWTVGVFVNELLDVVSEKADRYKFDFVQLHGNESPEYCYEINNECKVIKSFGIDELFDWNTVIPYLDVCDYFLFDTNTKGYGGSGEKFNWTILDKYRLSKPFFLSGGIGPDDVETIKMIQHPYLVGIDINSRFEISPGLKNVPQLKTFFNDIRRI